MMVIPPAPMPDFERYDPHAIEARWQRVWADADAFYVPNPQPSTDFCQCLCVLERLPYPSGRLRMGHSPIYTLGDVLTRFQRRNGLQVRHPICFASFGLPA